MAQKHPIFAKENMDQKRLSLLSAYSTSNLTSFPEHLFGNSEITCQSFHSLEQIESDESRTCWLVSIIFLFGVIENVM